MLDFALEFARVVERWPDNTPWTIAQIADYTSSTISTAVDAISTTLGREFDIQETISVVEGRQVLAGLQERLQRQIEARERKSQAEREAAIRAHDLTMERIRVSQMARDYRTAYKTLAYFVGRYDKSLPHDLLVSLCGDCIRLGMKAGYNMQEVGQWLRKAIEAAVVSGSPENIQDAIDFIDAYGEVFAADAHGVGAKILGNLLSVLEVPALDCNLMTEWQQVNTQLRPQQ